MAMTRKHYESIAKQINLTLSQHDDLIGIKYDRAREEIDWDPQIVAAGIIDRLVTNLIGIFEIDNDRFDRQQFRKAIRNTWYQYDPIAQKYDEDRPNQY